MLRCGTRHSSSSLAATHGSGHAGHGRARQGTAGHGRARQGGCVRVVAATRATRRAGRIPTPPLQARAGGTRWNAHGH